MAVLRCDFTAETLGLQTTMSVVLPELPLGTVPPPDGFPTLYLLHGLTDDHSMWLRRTRIETYAAERGIAVVMPEVARSFYTDEKYGLDYWTFLTEELPTKAEAMFRLSPHRADRFVAGLSMGGYGAFKWALRRPEMFAAAASLSGAMDLPRLQRERDDVADAHQMYRLFGDSSIDGTPNDLFSLITVVLDPPALYLRCGNEDYLIDDNERFIAACEAAGLALTSELDLGEHDWPFWDRTIRDVIEWLPIRASEATGA